MEHAVLVCVPDAALSSSVAPCGPINGVSSSPALVKSYLMTADQGAFFETLDQPFDYTAAAGFWSVGFIGTLTLWAIAKASGSVLTFIRQA